MKILFLTSGKRVPSARFRVLQYVPYLRARGHRCVVAHSVPPKYDYWPAFGWRVSQFVKRAVRGWHWLRGWLGGYDVIFLERGLFHDDTWSMEAKFRRIAHAMVLDVDDAVFLEHPGKFDAVVRMCDVVIAGNRWIQERVEPLNSSVVVIPTCVDLATYRLKATVALPTQRPVVGWMGTSSNLGNLAIVAPALRNLASRCDFELRVVTEDDAPLASLDLGGVSIQWIRWNASREIEQLHAFDVGIMPLDADREWNRYKCGFKLIQYMAVGTPAVASPVGVNRDLVRHGENGFLADSSVQWESCLETLLRDPELRKRMSVAARRIVEEGYSLDVCLPRLIQALEQAVDRRKFKRLGPER